MSILESMRSGTDSTFMQVLLAIVVVSFVFWYATPQGDVAAERANVNGTRIMSPDVDRALRIQLGGASLQSDEEWARAQQVMLDQLVKQELVRQAASDAGLVLDVDRDTRMSWNVALMRSRDPNFKDENGEFDEELYRAAIKYYQYTTDEYEALLQKQVVTGKMSRLMAAAVVVPDQMLEDAYIDQNTRATLEYVRLRPTNFNDQVDTSPEAIAAWMEANPGSVEAAYAAESAGMTIPESVDVRMIAFKLSGDGQGAAELRPRMQAILDEINASGDPDATMADLARMWSEHPTADDGGALGMKPVADLSEQVLEGIEGLEAGQVSDIQFGDSLVSIYRLNERTEARTPPLEEVQDDIAGRLMRERETPALAAAYAETLRSQWASGAAPTPVELAELGLVLQTSDPMNAFTPPSRLAPPPSMVKDALSAEEGSVLPQVYQAAELTDNALFVGRLVDIEEPDMARFASERDAIRRQVTESQRQEFLAGWVDGMQAEAGL